MPAKESVRGRTPSLRKWLSQARSSRSRVGTRFAGSSRFARKRWWATPLRRPFHPNHCGCPYPKAGYCLGAGDIAPLHWELSFDSLFFRHCSASLPF